MAHDGQVVADKIRRNGGHLIRKTGPVEVWKLGEKTWKIRTAGHVAHTGFSLNRQISTYLDRLEKNQRTKSGHEAGTPANVAARFAPRPVPVTEPAYTLTEVEPLAQDPEFPVREARAAVEQPVEHPLDPTAGLSEEELERLTAPEPPQPPIPPTLPEEDMMATEKIEWDEALLTELSRVKGFKRIPAETRVMFARKILEHDPTKVWKIEDLAKKLPAQLRPGNEIHHVVTGLSKALKDEKGMEVFRKGIPVWVRLKTSEKTAAFEKINSEPGRIRSDLPAARRQVTADEIAQERQGAAVVVATPTDEQPMRQAVHPRLPDNIQAQMAKLESSDGVGLVRNFEFNVGVLLGMLRQWQGM